MENRLEHPVLLSYSMPESRRLFYFFLPLIGLLFEMALLFVWMRTGGRGFLVYIVPWVLIAVSYFLLFTPFWRAVARLECTAVGLYFASVPFPENDIFAAWDSIRAIRHGIWGFAVLEIVGKPAVFLRLPAEEERRFLALLREASDARTAGW